MTFQKHCHKNVALTTATVLKPPKLVKSSDLFAHSAFTGFSSFSFFRNEHFLSSCLCVFFLSGLIYH